MCELSGAGPVSRVRDKARGLRILGRANRQAAQENQRSTRNPVADPPPVVDSEFSVEGDKMRRKRRKSKLAMRWTQTRCHVVVFETFIHRTPQ